MNESYAEPAILDETKAERKPNSTKLLQAVQVGETQRIVHHDVGCHKQRNGHRACTLNINLTRLRNQGRVFRSYHEADHIIVVERLA